MKKALALALIASCTFLVGNELSPAQEQKKKLKVVTTTTMITDAVRIVGGERVDLTGLMGPGVDPHKYEATAGDMKLVDQADLVFYSGLHLEGQMGEIFAGMGAKGVAVSARIPRDRLLQVPGFEGGYDPHFWFDARLWKEAVEQIRDTLSNRDADGAKTFEDNTEKYLAELDKLHEEVKAKAKELPENRRRLVTAHDAFNYFSKAYGFEVQGLQGVSTEAEASIGDVEKLAQFIVDNKIPAIFVESSVNQKNMIAVQQAVRAKGHAVKIPLREDHQLFSDALGDPGTPSGTYVGMMRHNINTIVDVMLHPEKIEDLAPGETGWSLRNMVVLLMVLVAGLGLLIALVMSKR